MKRLVKIFLCVMIVLGIGLSLLSCKGKEQGTYYLYENDTYN